MLTRWIGLKEAAELLGVSVSALRLWISQDRLPCSRAGSRILLDRELIEKRLSQGQLLHPAGQGASKTRAVETGAIQ